MAFREWWRKVRARDAGTPFDAESTTGHSENSTGNSAADSQPRLRPGALVRARGVAVTAAERVAVRDAVEQAVSFGFTPQEAVTAEKVTWHVSERKDILRRPLRSVLHTRYRADVSEQPIFDRVFSRDYEFIETPSAYETLVYYAALAAGTLDSIFDIGSELDFETKTGRLAYRVAGRDRRYLIRLGRAGGDPDVIAGIMADVAPPGCAPYVHEATYYWVPAERVAAFATALTASAES